MTELLDRARAIGFEVWAEKAVRRYGKSIDRQWVDRVQAMYAGGQCDKDDAVKAALAALSTLPDAVEGERSMGAKPDSMDAKAELTRLQSEVEALRAENARLRANLNVAVELLRLSCDGSDTITARIPKGIGPLSGCWQRPQKLRHRPSLENHLCRIMSIPSRNSCALWAAGVRAPLRRVIFLRPLHAIFGSFLRSSRVD